MQGIGLDRLCSKFSLFFFSFMLKEWPYLAFKSAYYAFQESQNAYYAPNFVEVIFNFSQFHIL